MAKVKKTISIDEEAWAQIETYAGALHLSPSAFVSLMVTQIDQVLRISVAEKNDAGQSGES